MKIIKKVNTSAAIALDSNGREVVVFGKGIGFPDVPYELDNLECINRTFYDVDPRYLEMIENVDENILDVAMKIRNYANSKGIITSSNLFFSLVDHINFAIQRQDKGLYFTLPIKDDIRFQFEEEIDVGRYALQVIKSDLGISFPKDEECYIALNVINSETEVNNRRAMEERIISDITDIISNDMEISINRESPNYSRFCSHMYYLLKRLNRRLDNYSTLVETVKKSNPKEFACAVKICEYLDEKGCGKMGEDEQLFLALHVNRLCCREK